MSHLILNASLILTARLFPKEPQKTNTNDSVEAFYPDISGSPNHHY